MSRARLGRAPDGRGGSAPAGQLGRDAAHYGFGFHDGVREEGIARSVRRAEVALFKTLKAVGKKILLKVSFRLDGAGQAVVLADFRQATFEFRERRIDP